MKLTVKENSNYDNYDIPDVCPEGAHEATCVDLWERAGVEEAPYGDPNGPKVLKDKCRILFAVNVDGQTHLVQTYDYNLSGSPKSNLFKLIKAWLVKAPPPGFDTLDLLGQTCMLNISHETSKKGNTYASISSIMPCANPSAAPDINSVEIPGGRKSEIPVAAGSSDEGAGVNPF